MKTTDARRRLHAVAPTNQVDRLREQLAATADDQTRQQQRRLDRAGFIRDALVAGDTVTAEYWTRVLLRELADHNEKTKTPGGDAA